MIIWKTSKCRQAESQGWGVIWTLKKATLYKERKSGITKKIPPKPAFETQQDNQNSPHESLMKTLALKLSIQREKNEDAVVYNLGFTRKYKIRIVFINKRKKFWIRKF